LLSTGQEYFPQLLRAIAAAHRSIHLEAYLYEDDPVGRQVTEALVQAAGRGVQVHLIIDGFGGGEHVRPPGPGTAAAWRADPDLPARSAGGACSGACFRRLHRKLVVIDQTLAFVGGINVIAEPANEPGPRLDFAVACEGPIVSPITLSAERPLVDAVACPA